MKEKGIKDSELDKLFTERRFYENKLCDVNKRINNILNKHLKK